MFTCDALDMADQRDEIKMNVAPPKFGAKSLIGAAVHRKEDDAFIRGKGCYTSDIRKPGMLESFVVRSPIANAAFRITSVEDARSAPGVHLVLTADDISHLGTLTAMGMQPGPDGTKAPYRPIPVLASDRVRHVGDAVAFVVADTLDQAKDAAELIEIDFDSDDAVTKMTGAMEDGAPLVWPEAGSNTAYLFATGDQDATKKAFANAAHVTSIDFVQNRLVSNYMETRAAIGEYEEDANRFTLTCGSQGVHGQRNIIRDGIFGGDIDLRVVTPDVGGGFGPKGFVYREYPLVLEAAKRLGKPVRWVGDRTEHFLVDAHGRNLPCFDSASLLYCYLHPPCCRPLRAELLLRSAMSSSAHHSDMDRSASIAILLESALPPGQCTIKASDISSYPAPESKIRHHSVARIGCRFKRHRSTTSVPSRNFSWSR